MWKPAEKGLFNMLCRAGIACGDRWYLRDETRIPPDSLTATNGMRQVRQQGSDARIVFWDPPLWDPSLPLGRQTRPTPHP